MKNVLTGVIVAAVLAGGMATVGAQSKMAPIPGRHSTEGEVTRVDTKDGWVHVKTSDGTMIVHFPPSEIQDLHKGDRITVHLALKDNGPAPK